MSLCRFDFVVVVASGVICCLSGFELREVAADHACCKSDDLFDQRGCAVVGWCEDDMVAFFAVGGASAWVGADSLGETFLVEAHGYADAWVEWLLGGLVFDEFDLKMPISIA